MEHSSESVRAELDRCLNGAHTIEAPPVLSVFEVQAQEPFGVYSTRLHEVMKGALELATAGMLDGEDDAPVDGIPKWFRDISTPDRAKQAPEITKAGKRKYLSRVESTPWELQNWLFQFDPEIDSRGWEWWHITSPGGSSGNIWVDSWGESHFGCQDFRWLAYTAGAESVSGPYIAPRKAWEEELNASVLG